ncbi:glycosidase [Paenibacillus sp. DS2015]|uniref:glycoside hydrolase family 13 protein n=1 Tax=Paenibacillus sp. DS2015 TaxID=3373917 RepID=UPI003D250B21
MITSFYHEPAVDAVLISLQQMEIRLRLPSHTSKVRLLYWNKYKLEQYGVMAQPMTLWAESEDYKYYRVVLTGMESRIRYLQYKFEFESENEQIWLHSDGMKRTDETKGGFAFSYAGDRDAINSPEWIGNRVWYQVFPERFSNGNEKLNPDNTVPWGTTPTRDNYMGGDIQGIIDRLDHLSGLGINALYLNPIFRATSNHKYDTTDYFKIDEQFGSLEDFNSLVRQCHERDIKVILDLVINHCGYYHPYFQDVIVKGENSEYKEWFYINQFPVKRSEEDYDSVGYYQWMPKLRTSNPSVQQYIFDIVSFWQKESGIDGWRIDVADEVEISFLRELKTSVKRLNPNAIIIAEIWDDAKRLMLSGAVDSVMNYELRSVLFDYILDRSITLGQFHARLVHFVHRYSSAELHQMFNLLGSHDTERILTRCKENEQDLSLLLAFQFMLPGNPTVYYGDEIGMTGENDPGCRASMPWESISLDNPLFQQFKFWIDRKKSDSSLQDGGLELQYMEDLGCYLIHRHNEFQDMYLLINFSSAVLEVQPILEQLNMKESHCIYNSDAANGRSDRIHPRQFHVFQTMK